MGRGGRASRTLFGTIAFLAVIWFLFVGVISHHSTKITKKSTKGPSTGYLMRWKFPGREKHFLLPDFDLHYVSKRRVPNGPDPIHNRRAEKSRQPPGRA